MKTRILLMFLCMLAGIQMRAADGDSFTATTAEGIEMTFVVTSEENLTAKVGDGTNTAVDVATSGTLTIPASVEYGDNIYNVTTVSANAFKGCTGIENVNIEEGITSLGASVFQGCTKIVSFNLPNTISSFGGSAFNGCKALKSIHVPDGITTISASAFYGCISLNEVVLSPNTTTINSKSFQNCSALKTIDLPEGLKKISADSFNSSGLTSLELPSSITTIEGYVFYNCKQLKKVIARMATPVKFGTGAFSLIPSSCGLHVPEGTKNAYVKAGWTSTIFKSGVVEGDDTPVIGDTFMAITEDGVEITYAVTDVDNWIVRVGDGSNSAIDSSSNTETVVIPTIVSVGDLTYNVTSIASKAFFNCGNINDVSIPNTITNIGSQAFSNCTSLEKVQLPASLSLIENQAFNGCTGLKTVYARMETPFTFGTNAFSNISNYCGLHVPEGTKVDYLEAGWTKEVFKGGVVEGDDALTGGFKFTQANADGVEITYVIVDIDEKTVQVGDDTAQALSTETSGTITIPETVDYDGVTYSVATIGNNAFAGIAGITDVNMPETLKNIGANAFKDCTGLTTVTIPASVTSIGTNAFGGCTNLTKVINRNTAPFTLTANSFAGINDRCGLHVPEGLKNTYLEAGWTEKVFKGGVVEGDNTLLKGDSFTVADENGVDIIYVVTDPDNKIVKVGNGTDKAIASETKGKVSVPSEVTCDEVNYSVNSISANAFKGCKEITNVEIGENIVSIGESAFQGSTGLLSMDIPENVTTLGNNIFNGCSSLQSVILPSTITSIPFGAFKQCSSLTELNFPEKLKSIAQDAFNSSGITIAILPEGLTSIGSWCFYQCSNLKTITLPESVKSIGDFALGFSGITSITIPESLTKLPNYLLADCYYLKEVHLPSTLTNIPREMFRHNLSLESIEIPEGVTSIAYFAFYDCPKLTEVTLPSTLTSAELRAFYYCAGLKKVIARMENPFQMPTEMFGECTSSIALHIPEGTHDKYVEAGWISDIFPGGIVYGDDTPTLNEVFTFTTQEGVEVTAVLTDIEKKTIQVGLGTSGNPAIDQATQGIVTLPDTVEAFGQKYVITTIGGYAFRYCNDVTEVKMPATVTHIGRYGFGNMDNLEKAVLPDSLIAMETAAFYRDAKLSELKLNEGLQDIGNYSFSYAAISEVEIPKSVTNIGRSSFAACENLDKVISRIEVPFAFQSDAFTGISSTCGLHVPEGTKEAYIEQGWTEETFPGGIVYGDETLHKGQSFDVTEEDGTRKTFRVTDVNEMKAEMVSVKAGSEAGGIVTLMPTATHELTGNVYTVSSIADKAFGADVKKVLSRIETPFAVSSAAFASLSPMCSLHVPAGTKAAYLENGWTEESFKAGVVEGDDTLVKGQTFTLTDEDGTSTTYRVTDVNDNLVEIVSAKEGGEADGRVSIQQAVTDPVAGNDYMVGSIGNGAFNENLKAVTAEAETPYPVTPEAFKGIGEKCVLFVPAGTKDAYIENGWTEDIFKGGIYEGNIPGDVNEDLAVDISDIVAVINTIADPEGSTYRYADVNEDGKVDISDIVKIINIIAEK